MCEKNYIWDPATCTCKNRKYLATIIDDLVITYDENIGRKKTVLKKRTSTRTVLIKSTYKKIIQQIFIDYYSIIENS